MTGSSPKPSPNLISRPSRTKRYRSNQPVFPKAAIGALFVVYILIGLLLSLPTPPFWIWIPAVIGTVLLVWGLNSPLATGSVAIASGKSPSQAELQSYVGALLLVVALAIAANYIGGGKSFDNIHFFVAVFGLALLTSLSIALTAAAAIISAQAGASLVQIMDYKLSLTIVMSTCFCGIFVGGLAGFLSTTL